MVRFDRNFGFAVTGSDSVEGDLTLLCDGMTLSELSITNRRFSQVRIQGVDGKLVRIVGYQNYNPVLSSLFLIDPYAAIARSGAVLEYLREETFGTESCEALRITERDGREWKLLISVADSLPRAMELIKRPSRRIGQKRLPRARWQPDSSYTLKIVFRDWELSNSAH